MGRYKSWEAGPSQRLTVAGWKGYRQGSPTAARRANTSQGGEEISPLWPAAAVKKEGVSLSPSLSNSRCNDTAVSSTSIFLRWCSFGLFKSIQRTFTILTTFFVYIDCLFFLPLCICGPQSESELEDNANDSYYFIYPALSNATVECSAVGVYIHAVGRVTGKKLWSKRFVFN